MVPKALSRRVAYFRCMDGEWFFGRYCPLDSVPKSKDLVKAELAAEDKDLPLTLENLLAVGLPKELLHRVLIVEFHEQVGPWDVFRPARRQDCPGCQKTLPRDFWADQRIPKK